MSNLYKLVNLTITEEFNSSIKAKNSNEAAQKLYSSLSEHFNNAVPQYLFTIQKGESGSGKYYHYKAKESRSGNDVTFTIKPFTIANEDMTTFNQKLAKFKGRTEQDGGKKKKTSRKSKKYDDSDDDDSDSERYYKKINTYVPVANTPMMWYWYDPLVYNTNSVFIPTLYSYVSPVMTFYL